MPQADPSADIAGNVPQRAVSRLQAELQRLYGGPEAGRSDPLRTIVLELARPASWVDIAKVWQGVQADLGLPAPAIAVSGSDAYQLWFSLEQRVSAAQAMSFVEALRKRYLADVEPRRVSLQPGCVFPAAEVAPGHWSAFVTPDLAALFADEPWLDLPPGADAQADLLSRVGSAKADAWQQALELLGPATAATTSSTERQATEPAPSADLEPRQFLLDVMNDRAIDMHLRIEAAKALLPHVDPRRRA